ncbi:hypothetical protein J4Q44_G00260100 [Coregonus suidteri]|uniref:Uncharacterized protein n=1 Tax=Coregonus suidteri TaxID=861788 RepID=A0AAN8LLS4_9TELE
MAMSTSCVKDNMVSRQASSLRTSFRRWHRKWSIRARLFYPNPAARVRNSKAKSCAVLVPCLRWTSCLPASTFGRVIKDRPKELSELPVVVQRGSSFVPDRVGPLQGFPREAGDEGGHLLPLRWGWPDAGEVELQLEEESLAESSCPVELLWSGYMDPSGCWGVGGWIRLPSWSRQIGCSPLQALDDLENPIHCFSQAG